MKIEKPHKKNLIRFCILLSAMVLIALIVVSGYFIFNSKKNPGNKFDENNVGEIYCAPIDEKHVAADKSGVMFADNEILVVAKEGTEKTDIEKLAKEYKAEIVGFIEQTGDYQLKFSDTYSLDELEKTADQLKNEKNVSLADVNYICKMSDDSVEDIKLGDKWENDLFKGTNFFTGKTKFSSNDKMWGAKAINAPTAWHAMDLLKNNIEPVKVGLIDSGFDKDHEDLGFAEIFYDNGVNGVESKDIVDKDYKYHGTHVAGTMAARGDNKEGICGIYPYANNNLYAVSTTGLEKYTENSMFYSSVMIYKIGYAELILRNVKIINQSEGFNWDSNWDEYYHSLFNTEESWNEYQHKLFNDDKFKKQYKKLSEPLRNFFNRMLDKGYDFVIVCSAGNNSNDSIGNIESKYNSWLTLIEDDKNRSENKVNHDIFDRIIVVGAVDKKYNISNFSDAGNRVDIFAPGENIYSTIAGNKYGIKYTNSESKNVTFSGTSMASPHVAGVCADVWSMNKYLTGAEVKDIVCRSTIDNVVVYTTPNKETRGVVDANKAVAEAYNRLATSGRVIKEPENGAILGWVVEKDNEDKKIKKADITAVTEKGGSEKYTAETDEYGHFELILPKGDYTITVKAKGYKDYTFYVKLPDNGEIIYPDWVKMEKKLTKAEKYAKIVMDNEDLWLEPLDLEHASEKPTTAEIKCWFEDLDFDEIPEFIVGPTRISWGMAVLHDYEIYKIKGDSLERMTSDEEYYLNSNASLTIETNFSNEFEMNNFGLSLYKENNNYKYAYPAVSSYNLKYSFTLVEVDFSGNAPKRNNIYSYYEAEGEHSYSSSSNEIDKNQLIKNIEEEIKNDTMCKVTTQSVTLTNEFGEITSSDYSNLSSKEKYKQLIDSVNAYKISELSQSPDFFELMLNSLKSNSWKSAYVNFINDYISERDNYTRENASFYLIDINGDDIPEMHIQSGSGAGGSTMVTFDGEKISSINSGNSSGIKYIKGENIFIYSGGHMDVYYDEVYKISDGEFELIARGDFGAENNSEIKYDDNGMPIYVYYWNDKQVSKDNYKKLLNKACDTSKAKLYYESDIEYSYSEIFNAIDLY